MSEKSKLTKAVLIKKSEEQLKEILNLKFGYTLGVENTTSKEMVELILKLQDKMVEKEGNKFDFLDHLKDILPMTEQMITDAFYSSSPAFRQKYLKDSDLAEDRKKDIFYEVRDIVVSNNFKVMRPDPSKKNEKVVLPKATANTVKFPKEPNTTPGGGKLEHPIDTEKILTNEELVESVEPAEKVESGEFDISTLTKKGDKVNYIIDLLIQEGGDIQKDIKAKGVMNKYLDVFDESVSDGYAYDKIVERKKALA